MRILILNYDYDDFLYELYSNNSELKNKSYNEQVRARINSLFGVADFYSRNLKKLGHEAKEIWINNPYIQHAWAVEKGLKIKPVKNTKKNIGRNNLIKGVFNKTLNLFNKNTYRSNDSNWIFDILSRQIEDYKPDVILNQTMHHVSVEFLMQLNSHYSLLVGQIASPIPQNTDFSGYDLIISSLPNIVDYFNNRGINSEHHMLGFDTAVLESLSEYSEDVKEDVTFVGSLLPFHGDRINVFEKLCSELPISIYGPDFNHVSIKSPLRKCYKGSAWGIEMYKILRKSKITLNVHIDISGEYANNFRLYEATGVGTFLLTDWKKNLNNIFVDGKELASFRSLDESIHLIKYYLTHVSEREEIALSGQKRTLIEHNFLVRMKKLEDIINKYIS